MISLNSTGTGVTRNKITFGEIWLKFNPLIILVALIIVASVATDTFMSYQNLFNVLRQSSMVGIISIGMLCVIVTGGIDLSVGSVMAVGSVLTAILIKTGGVAGSALTVIAVGLLFGALNGAFVTFRNVAPFVMTLASMTIARGLAYILSNGNPIYISNEKFLDFLQGAIIGIPGPVIFFIIVILVLFFVFRKTVLGRILVAIGSNEEAVRLSGIRVRLYKFSGYLISGGCAAVAGIIIAGRSGVGSPMVGTGMELDAIAAIVIGGAPLSGGKGSVIFTVIGALILGVISNFMNLMNIAAYPQDIVKGIIIIVAVMFQQGVKTKSTSRLD